jgi:DNA-binding GntR family transcriptional regulator
MANIKSVRPAVSAGTAAMHADVLEIPSDLRTIQQLATERIRRAILDGTFRPNDRLNHAELAERLKISRIPIREALRVLEGEGLVKSYPYRATVVSTMSAEEIEEAYEIRILLETSAAQRALGRMDAANVRRIRAAYEQMLEPIDPDTWVSLNSKFHQELYSASNWTRLMSIVEMLRNLTAPYVRLYVSDSSERDGANSEHGEIVAAVEARESVTLRAVLRKHLTHSCQGILSQIKKIEQEAKRLEAAK